MASCASVSVIVPADNEAGNIKSAINAIVALLSKNGIPDYEILLFDDCSNDGTERIADELAAHNARIQVIHNKTNKGLGYNFRTGVIIAQKEYVGWFPGDNETSHETIDNIFSAIAKGGHDVIVPYTFNPWLRPLHRRVLSAMYTAVFNAVFGLRLRYFNGACFFRRALLKNVKMTTDGPAYMAEILVQLIKKNRASYAEVPMFIRQRDYGTSRVLKWKNVWPIAKTLTMLFFRVRFGRQKSLSDTRAAITPKE